MSYNTYEEFDDEMANILSSGSAFEMCDYHETSIRKLFKGMDRDSVVEFANKWYGGQDAHELREGELYVVAELLNELEPDSVKVSPTVQIAFK